MWLTGFDAPSLHTMYLDKPMQGHGLFQAITRVNRVFKDKPVDLNNLPTKRDPNLTVKGGEKVYHCGGGIVYHRQDEKGLNWEPGGIRSGAGVRSSGVSQESTGSSDTWEAALCRLCLRR